MNIFFLAILLSGFALSFEGPQEQVEQLKAAGFEDEIWIQYIEKTGPEEVQAAIESRDPEPNLDTVAAIVFYSSAAVIVPIYVSFLINMVKFRKAMRFSNPLEPCSICLDTLQSSQIAALTCGHAVHSDCLKKWWKGTGDKCPLCRNIVDAMLISTQLAKLMHWFYANPQISPN